MRRKSCESGKTVSRINSSKRELCIIWGWGVRVMWPGATWTPYCISWRGHVRERRRLGEIGRGWLGRVVEESHDLRGHMTCCVT